MRMADADERVGHAQTVGWMERWSGLLDDLAEFEGLAVRAEDVEVADALVPEARNGLNLILLNLQTEFFRVLPRGLDIRNVERPVVDRTGGQRGRITLPSLDGQVAIAQEGATVLTVVEQAGEFEAERLGVELDGLIRSLAIMPECWRSVVNSVIFLAMILL